MHSDDVILGLPWLNSRHAVIHFATRSLSVRHDDDVGPRMWYELPLTEVQSAGSVNKLVTAVTALYTMDSDNSVENDPVKNGSLAELLRDPDCTLRRLAELNNSDDRGSMRPRDSEAEQRQRGSLATDPTLDALRKKMWAEFEDTIPAALPPGLPPGRGHELHIEQYPGSRPPHRQPPRMNQKHAEFEAKWLKTMRANGAISPSESEYAAPHFYVNKPDSATTGEYRAVTDFRLLNAQTVKNRYPLPRPDQLFDKLAHAKYFSKIDLRTGFYQILINEKDRHKTAFTTSQGLFEYNVLPMGLCNSPGVFMALMNDTFQEYLDKFVLVFLDDIIVYSNTLEEHERHLRLALQQLRKQRLYAKKSKSVLCQTEVEFLGHYVGRNGLRVMEDKIAAVRDWPTPTKIQELRAFLGLAGYYRRFVKDFSAIALPLTELTRNVTHQKLQWNTTQQLAFVELKRALQSTPVLALPDATKPFVVHCDASGYAVGAVLQQDRGSGLQPVAYLSKKLSGAESRYPVHEQELLAIITALTTWRHYLSGTDVPVRIRTDHKSLTHFQTQPMLSGRQTRWLETLANYNYVIEYVAGLQNHVADALSRRADLQGGGAPELRPPAFVDTKSTFELNRIFVEQSRSITEELQAADAAQRRRRVNRQPEQLRVASRAQANEAATKIIPVAEIPADRPAPNQHGARVTPTQQCAANNRRGTQCGSLTAKGRYCFNHMRTEEGVRVTTSTVQGAGYGLFAARDFARGDHIADYTGDEVIPRNAGDGGPYCLTVTRRRLIDAARTNTGYGRWANDPRGTNSGPNAEFVVNVARKTGRVRATRRVRKGEEILVSYGPSYWNALGPHAKVVARPALQAQREVIDLTEMGTSTFSSEIADGFDRACATDPKYSARVESGQPEKPDEWVLRDGRLFMRVGGQLCVPEDLALRTALIRECHDAATSGHLGRDKTLAQMKRRFFWHGMDKQIGEYVTTCDACQKNKPSQQRTPGLLMSIPSPTVAGHTWTMDLITGLPRTRTGNDAIVVWTCKFSKLCHYAPCKTTIDAPSLARLFLNFIVRQHGMPVNIISDRDPRFTAHFWRAFWHSMGTTLSMSTAYHPQTDGQTENSNKTLEIMMRSVIDFDQKDWDEHLAAAELAVNNSKNATTGFTPFYLYYGQDARMPLDLALAPLTKAKANPAAVEATARWRRAQQQAFDNTEQAQQRQATYADQHRRPVRFAVGDRVWLSNANLKLTGETKRARKFTERYIGPYRIKRIVNANAYELELPASLKIHPVINVSRLKEHRDGLVAFPDRPMPLTRPEPVGTDDNGAPVWDVERVLDHRKYRKRNQYLVSWKGYPLSEATWEPIEHLDGALDLVIRYNSDKGVALNVITSLIPSLQLEKGVANSSTLSWVQVASRTKLNFQSRGGCNSGRQDARLARVSRA
jgi:hypothetical protein